MGYHYVPQYYLQGFAAAPDELTIWMYDRTKSNTSPRLLPIRSVAQEKAFYSDDDEQYLSTEIEQPANVVLQKIRARGFPSPAEKHTFSRYLAVMLRRVPRNRQRVRELYPRSAARVLHRWEIELASGAVSSTPLFQRVDQEEFLQALHDEYGGEIPERIFRQAIRPTLRKRLVGALETMTWVFMLCNRGPHLLTSDNPVFFFESIGLANAASEVSFPVARDIALWATRRTDLAEGFVEVRPANFREFNRRTVSQATRFVFAIANEPWTTELLRKPRLRLNSMVEW